MYGDAPLDDEVVRRVLIELWDLRVDDIDYVPIGYGSYHWNAVTSGGILFFVTADRVDGSSPVQAAYELAHRLADAGMSFVRAPRRHRGNAVMADVDGWWISVWPWLEGRTKSAEHEHASPADLEATVSCLRRLHDLRSIPRVAGLAEDWVIADRASLLELLGFDPGEWAVGPYANEVRSCLTSNRDTIARWFGRYDELVQSILVADVEFVITHGEPHAANVVHTAEGPMLIDWDTVRWAPRERDLWALGDSDSWRRAYGGDVRISDEVLEAYRLRWMLGEIAEFATVLAAAVGTDPDLEVALRELRNYLPGSQQRKGVHSAAPRY